MLPFHVASPDEVMAPSVAEAPDERSVARCSTGMKTDVAVGPACPGPQLSQDKKVSAVARLAARVEAAVCGGRVGILIIPAGGGMDRHSIRAWVMAPTAA